MPFSGSRCATVALRYREEHTASRKAPTPKRIALQSVIPRRVLSAPLRPCGYSPRERRMIWDVHTHLSGIPGVTPTTGWPG